MASLSVDAKNIARVFEGDIIHITDVMKSVPDIMLVMNQKDKDAAAEIWRRQMNKKLGMVAMQLRYLRRQEKKKGTQV